MWPDAERADGGPPRPTGRAATTLHAQPPPRSASAVGDVIALEDGGRSAPAVVRDVVAGRPPEDRLFAAADRRHRCRRRRRRTVLVGDDANGRPPAAPRSCAGRRPSTPPVDPGEAAACAVAAGRGAALGRAKRRTDGSRRSAGRRHPRTARRARRRARDRPLPLLLLAFAGFACARPPRRVLAAACGPRDGVLRARGALGDRLRADTALECSRYASGRRAARGGGEGVPRSSAGEAALPLALSLAIRGLAGAWCSRRRAWRDATRRWSGLRDEVGRMRASPRAAPSGSGSRRPCRSAVRLYGSPSRAERGGHVAVDRWRARPVLVARGLCLRRKLLTFRSASCSSGRRPTGRLVPALPCASWRGAPRRTPRRRRGEARRADHRRGGVAGLAGIRRRPRRSRRRECAWLSPDATSCEASRSRSSIRSSTSRGHGREPVAAARPHRLGAGEHRGPPVAACGGGPAARRRRSGAVVASGRAPHRSTSGEPCTGPRAHRPRPRHAVVGRVGWSEPGGEDALPPGTCGRRRRRHGRGGAADASAPRSGLRGALSGAQDAMTSR
jgi:hypothetical protein